MTKCVWSNEEKYHNSEYRVHYSIFDFNLILFLFPYAAFHENWFIRVSIFYQASWPFYFRFDFCTIYVQFLFNFCLISVQFLFDFCSISVQFLFNFCSISVWFLFNCCSIFVWFLYPFRTISVKFLMNFFKIIIEIQNY